MGAVGHHEYIYEPKLESFHAKRLYDMAFKILDAYNDEDEVILILIECINRIINAYNTGNYALDMEHKRMKKETYAKLFPILIDVEGRKNDISNMRRI